MPEGDEASQEEVPSFLLAYHADAANLGDRECGPGRHLAFPGAVTTRLKADLPLANTLILGGGGIFGSLEGYAQAGVLARYRRVVAWGVGVPTGGQQIARIWEVAKHFTAFGTRDYPWRDQFDFVPCASCLSPHFDGLPSASTEVVLYLHARKTVLNDFRAPEMPVMFNNTTDLREALEFIASGQTVVTNSYHGVYWAQLVGRRVVCVPYNTKFSGYQDAPTTATPSNWRDQVARAVAYPSRLEEYRRVNLAFRDRVLDETDA